MDSNLRPEIRLAANTPQECLALATAGVLRYVWEGRFGPMLIEVIDDKVYVNGQLVVPADSIPRANGQPKEG